MTRDAELLTGDSLCDDYLRGKKLFRWNNLHLKGSIADLILKQIFLLHSESDHFRFFRELRKYTVFFVSNFFFGKTKQLESNF